MPAVKEDGTQVDPSAKPKSLPIPKGTGFYLYTPAVHYNRITNLDIAASQAGVHILRHLSVDHEDEMGVRAWVCPWTKLNVKDVPDIDQNGWKALLEACGPRRISITSGTDPPVCITELQENVAEMRRNSMMD
ncbi:hypothetical protein FRC01_005963, partial [Tulasnella sp. 417]